MSRISSSDNIRDLNDAMRRGGPARGQWFLTPGVVEEGLVFTMLATRAVQTFADFSEDNDPYGEHDFGAFALAGKQLLWKIDYYDKSLSRGSEDPTDPSVTTRVLTIMLASEY